MQPESERLIVRQHDRLRCDLAARIKVDAAHLEQVAFSKAATDAGGVLAAKIVDCSHGGLGLQCAVFVPRACRLRVVASIPGSDAPTEIGVRVQRVTMLDRCPTFYVGTAMADEGSTSRAALERLLAFVRAGRRADMEASNAR